MLSRNVLLYLPALPHQITAFFPKRALALVAAVLRREGQHAEIWDYGVLEEFRAAAKLLKARPAPRKRLISRIPPGESDQEYLAAARRAAVLARLRIQPPDAVFLLANTRGEFGQVLSLSQALREAFPRMRQVLLGEYAAVFARMLRKDATWDVCLLPGAENSAADLACHWHVPSYWAKIQGVLGPEPAEGWRERLLRADPPPRPHYGRDAEEGVDATQQFAVYSLCHPEGQHHRTHYLPARWCSAPRGAWQVFEDELNDLQTRHGARVFWFAGGFSSQDIPAGFPAMLGEMASVAFGVELHAEQLRPGLAELLCKTGCRVASIQLDHGSQRLLEDFYGRAFGISGVEPVLSALRDQGIFSVGRFQFPCAEDDYHTRAEAVRFARRCRLNSVCVSAPQVLPGSVWRQRAGDFGYILNPRHYTAWSRGEVDGEDTGYRLRGLSPAKCRREHGQFREELLEAGLGLECSAPAALLARVSGQEGEEWQYSAECEEALTSFRVEALEGMICAFNERAVLPLNSRVFRRQPAYPAVVGN